MDLYSCVQQGACRFLGISRVNHLTSENRMHPTMVFVVPAVRVDGGFNIPTRLTRTCAVEPRGAQSHHKNNAIALAVICPHVTRDLELTARKECQFKTCTFPAGPCPPVM